MGPVLPLPSATEKSHQGLKPESNGASEAMLEGPKEISHSVKILLVTISIISPFFTAGVIHGFPGLYHTLAYDIGAFRNVCGELGPNCHAQHNALVLMYTVAAATISGISIIIGFFLDAYGPRKTACVGASLFGAGLLSLSWASQLAQQAQGRAALLGTTTIAHISNILFFVGFFLLAAGGPTMFNTMLNFGELFPKHCATIIAAQNGAFDMSVIVMFLMGKSAERQHFSFPGMCLGYTTVPAILFVLSALYFPDRPFGAESGPASMGELRRTFLIAQQQQQQCRSRSRSRATAIDHCGHCSEFAGPGEMLEKGEKEQPPDVYNTRVMKQLRSSIFWAHTAFTAYLLLRSNFYIATVYDQTSFTITTQLLHHHHHPNDTPALVAKLTSGYIDVFNYMILAGGGLMVPVGGFIMERLGMVPSPLIISITLAAFSTINIAAVHLPHAFQVLGFALYACCRPFIFAFGCVFIGRVFGFQNFGRLYGVNRIIAAVATTGQYPLVYISQAWLGGNYHFVNMGFLLCEIFLSIAFPLYLWRCVFYGFFLVPPLDDDDECGSRDELLCEAGRCCSSATAMAAYSCTNNPKKPLTASTTTASPKSHALAGSSSSSSSSSSSFPYSCSDDATSPV